jgi:UBX domain-containing protein 1
MMRPAFSYCSGMMVQDPTHKNNRDVDSIFDRARQFGAREGIEAPPAPSNRGAFSGQGRTLSGAVPEQGPTPSAPAPPTPVFHTITFWRNGFTVDDGPLRRLDDPANAPFLAVST